MYHSGRTHRVNALAGYGHIRGGYRRITQGNKFVSEHRMIMEKHLGRKLLPFPKEIVHHKDGNKLNNAIENLEIMSQAEHVLKHRGGKSKTHKTCALCEKFLPRNKFYKQHVMGRDKNTYACKRCDLKRQKIYRDAKKVSTHIKYG